jgi:HPt (histidine-containing phosphotransfer) domain-containing protein
MNFGDIEMTAETVINKITISELCETMGSEFFEELAASYLLDVHAQIDSLKKAHADGDADAFRRAAHSIKSTSLYFGADQLAAQARALEERGKSAEIADSDAEIAALTDSFDEVRKALKELGYE